jgi:hypothetical protein
MNSDETPGLGVTSGAPAATPNRNRRRLLLGAAGIVPSVYTLTSGAQVSAASAIVCLQASEDANPTRFMPGNGDPWLREPVQMGRFEQRNTYCVSTPQADCMNGFNPGDAGQGSQWIVEGVDGNVVTAGPGAPIQVSSGHHSYGLVYVDKDGTITTLDPGYTGDLYPTTKSCWASVLSAQGNRLG